MCADFSHRPDSSEPLPPLVPGEQEPPERRGLDRRALIGVGAGLVLGAGATQAANALTTTSSASAEVPDPPSAGEALMTEHGVLKRLMLVYQTASDQLANGKTPPAQAIAETAELIGDYVEGFHEGLEEAYIFPRVQPVHPALIHTLLVQHDRGRHLTSAISYLAGQNLEQQKARTALHRYLDLFVNMYARHEAWEDTVIFPAIRAVSTPQTLTQLATRFAELEDHHYGTSSLQKILTRVSNIEKQLGIADIDTFTPPEIDPPYD
jgi:hemerythrin-like domain-containing protein